MDRMPAFCLDMHADYGCQHSGECCTAGWAIPAEPAVVEAVQARFHRVGPSDSVVSGFSRTATLLFVTSGPSDAPPIVATRASGECVFFDEAHGRLCVIHKELGPDLLPSACRQFPRVSVTDDRGTHV